MVNVLLGIISLFLLYEDVMASQLMYYRIHRWDTELIDLSQTWVAKENSKDYL